MMDSSANHCNSRSPRYREASTSKTIWHGLVTLLPFERLAGPKTRKGDPGKSQSKKKKKKNKKKREKEKKWKEMKRKTKLARLKTRKDGLGKSQSAKGEVNTRVYLNPELRKA